MLTTYFYTLKCNDEYSSIEFNIPKIEYYEYQIDYVDLIEKIIKGQEDSYSNKLSDLFVEEKKFLPYLYNIDSVKRKI